jgi:ABC-type iron transport system FetAB permease component
VRGLLRMLAIGPVPVWLLKGAAWWSIPASAAKCATAARMGAAQGGVRPALVLAVFAGHKATALVPLGSMIIAGSMNTCSQVLERYASDLKLNAGRVEVALALGASSAEAALP